VWTANTAPYSFDVSQRLGTNSDVHLYAFQQVVLASIRLSSYEIPRRQLPLTVFLIRLYTNAPNVEVLRSACLRRKSSCQVQDYPGMCVVLCLWARKTLIFGDGSQCCGSVADCNETAEHDAFKLFNKRSARPKKTSASAW
jgi:hypothetical protein